MTQAIYVKSMACMDPSCKLSTVDNLPLYVTYDMNCLFHCLSYLYQYIHMLSHSYYFFPKLPQTHCIAMVFRSSNLLFTAGEFGIVYRARLTRSIIRKTESEIVAVKTVKGKDI